MIFKVRKKFKQDVPYLYYTRRDIMNPELESVYEHMLKLGLGALAHANYHSAYWAPENEEWGELSVLQAAHAAEILIKARIAQEHPLLIFEDFPKLADQELSLIHI